jgi:hypothetical protein
MRKGWGRGGGVGEIRSCRRAAQVVRLFRCRCRDRRAVAYVLLYPAAVGPLSLSFPLSLSLSSFPFYLSLLVPALSLSFSPSLPPSLPPSFPSSLLPSFPPSALSLHSLPLSLLFSSFLACMPVRLPACLPARPPLNQAGRHAGRAGTPTPPPTPPPFTPRGGRRDYS